MTLIVIMLLHDRDRQPKLLLGKRRVALAIVLASIGILASLWLAIGYGWVQQGEARVSKGEWTQAEAAYATARWMLPWSPTVTYDKAKMYILLGNETGDFTYYETAHQLLTKAHRMLPEQTLYLDLMEEIELKVPGTTRNMSK